MARNRKEFRKELDDLDQYKEIRDNYDDEEVLYDDDYEDEWEDDTEDDTEEDN